MKRLLTSAGAGIMLATLPGLAFAGYAKFWGGENVAAMLYAEHDIQATAFGLYVEDWRASHADAAIDTTSRKFRIKAGSKLNSATVARGEYRVNANDASPSLVLHSSSGPSIEARFDRVSGQADSGSSDVDTPEAIAENVEKEATEMRFFPANSATDIRAGNFVPRKGGRVFGSDLGDGKAHFADAELKIAGEMEGRFLDKTLPEGGQLVVYVSQPVCGSCNAGLQALADAYNVDVKVYQLGGAVTSGADAAADAAASAGKSLFEVRKAQTNVMLGEIGTGELRVGTWSGTTRRAQRLQADLVQAARCP
jgi:hypothetical protein